MDNEKRQDALEDARRDEMMQRVNQLPPLHQEVISSYSGFFLEPDIRKKFQDPMRQRFLEKTLRGQGFDDEGVSTALEVFGFKPKIDEELDI